MRPDPADLTGISSAHRQLIADVARWGDTDLAAPSLLPGWSRGHVLTHLARNADSFVHLLHAAARGEIADQYPGGLAQREGDIERGSTRPADVVLGDLADACAAVETAFADADESAWAGSGRGLATPPDFNMMGLPLRRWREVEVHRGDLGGELTWRNWSDAYVERELPVQLDRVGTRLEGQLWERPAAVTDHEVLAWLLGRNPVSQWPTLTPW
jgi:maleylpyruvate isomerase